MNYEDLVSRRKNHYVQYTGFTNQYKIEQGRYDQGNYLDPWAKWHNKVPADILVVGQDWGNVDYYAKNEGRDNDNNPTCLNLAKLFHAADKNIGKPSNPNSNITVHFANVIPFLRTGEMQGNKFIRGSVLSESIDNFLTPLIELVNPKIIITLGAVPLKAVISAFKNIEYGNKRLKELIEISPLILNDKTILFPMFHCGAMGVNFNRNMARQIADWEKLKKHFHQLTI